MKSADPNSYSSSHPISRLWGNFKTAPMRNVYRVYTRYSRSWLSGLSVWTIKLCLPFAILIWVPTHSSFAFWRFDMPQPLTYRDLNEEVGLHDDFRYYRRGTSPQGIWRNPRPRMQLNRASVHVYKGLKEPSKYTTRWLRRLRVLGFSLTLGVMLVGQEGVSTKNCIIRYWRVYINARWCRWYWHVLFFLVWYRLLCLPWPTEVLSQWFMEKNAWASKRSWIRWLHMKHIVIRM